MGDEEAVLQRAVLRPAVQAGHCLYKGTAVATMQVVGQERIGYAYVLTAPAGLVAVAMTLLKVVSIALKAYAEAPEAVFLSPETLLEITYPQLAYFLPVHFRRIVFGSSLCPGPVQEMAVRGVVLLQRTHAEIHHQTVALPFLHRNAACPGLRISVSRHIVARLLLFRPEQAMPEYAVARLGGAGICVPLPFRDVSPARNGKVPSLAVNGPRHRRAEIGPGPEQPVFFGTLRLQSPAPVIAVIGNGGNHPPGHRASVHEGRLYPGAVHVLLRLEVPLQLQTRGVLARKLQIIYNARGASGLQPAQFLPVQVNPSVAAAMQAGTAAGKQRRQQQREINNFSCGHRIVFATNIMYLCLRYP